MLQPTGPNAAGWSGSISAPRPSALPCPIRTAGLPPASRPSIARRSSRTPPACSQSTRAFARNLAALTTLPIGLWDERLSTAAVERELIGMDVSRAKRAEVIDEHAAIFILQGALDRLANLRAASGNG